MKPRGLIGQNHFFPCICTARNRGAAHDAHAISGWLRQFSQANTLCCDGFHLVTSEFAARTKVIARFELLFWVVRVRDHKKPTREQHPVAFVCFEASPGVICDLDRDNLSVIHVWIGSDVAEVVHVENTRPKGTHTRSATTVSG